MKTAGLFLWAWALVNLFALQVWAASATIAPTSEALTFARTTVNGEPHVVGVTNDASNQIGGVDLTARLNRPGQDPISLFNEFAQFGVWQDANSDGIQQEGEFVSLEEQGIAEINLQSDQNTQYEDGNTIFGLGSYVKTDGTVEELADVAFGIESENVEWEQLNEFATLEGGEELIEAGAEVIAAAASMIRDGADMEEADAFIAAAITSAIEEAGETDGIAA